MANQWTWAQSSCQFCPYVPYNSDDSRNLNQLTYYYHNYWCYLQKKCTQSPRCCDPVHYCSGLVNILCQDDLEHWGHNCFQNPCPEAERFRSCLQTEQGGLNLKHTGTKEQKETHTQVVLSWNKPVKSSSLQKNLQASFIPALISTQITYLPHTVHLVMPHTRDMCTRELLLLPLLDCTSDLLSYNYHDV